MDKRSKRISVSTHSFSYHRSNIGYTQVPASMLRGNNVCHNTSGFLRKKLKGSLITVDIVLLTQSYGASRTSSLYASKKEKQPIIRSRAECQPHAR